MGREDMRMGRNERGGTEGQGADGGIAGGGLI